MYNEALILERLAVIQKTVKRLKALQEQLSREEFLTNEDAIDIAENRLRRALEALFDLGRHLVVKSGLGVPADYRSIIEKLKDAQILPADFAQKIIGMAGYRNRLIHEYSKVTPEELYEILENRLNDLTLFCHYIVSYLEKASKEQPLNSDN
ncbi:MAG: type VII toxin-antitoxin system HepT family RNase toxin [Moorellaceae bacterium]